MTKSILELPAVVTKEENWFVAVCPTNNIVSQGKTVEEALANLKEALELFYEEEKEIVIQSPLVTHVDIELERGVKISHVQQIARGIRH